MHGNKLWEKGSIEKNEQKTAKYWNTVGTGLSEPWGQFQPNDSVIIHSIPGSAFALPLSLMLSFWMGWKRIH